MDKIKKVIKQILSSVELEKECMRLLESGGVDMEEGSAAKAIVCVALRNEAEEYYPLSSEGKEIVKNLSHF